jgi:penicillin-binding protein 2
MDRGDAEKQANYKGTDHIGKTGLEQHYEFELHGETGYEEVEIDAGGRALRSLKRIPPVSGNNLQLDLDAKLQQITEQAFGERKGALVAIDPSTGGILALVSNPTYDPNLFVDGITPDNWKELNDHPSKPMVNRAINGSYPPGQPSNPSWRSPRWKWASAQPTRRSATLVSSISATTISATTRKGGHGTVDMYKSIVHSCDTYYYILANDMGIDNISKFMGQLGFGQRTGIDLGKDDSRRNKRRSALAGMEKAALQKAGAAEMVCRRNDFHRHRPGLQRIHAHPTRPGDCCHRE